MNADPSLSIGQCVSLACVWEASAPKVGNVNRNADFHDTTFYDFVTSAAAISPILDTAPERSLGENVLACIQATREVVACNTNLGIVLLLAPLAMVPREQTLGNGVSGILNQLDCADCHQVYEAIQLASPGGLGEVELDDVNQEAPDDLIQAMKLAQDRDLIARQYCNGFAQVFELVVPSLISLSEAGVGIIEAVIETQLRLLRDFPDSLIARKCGAEVATRASELASEVLQHPAGSEQYLNQLSHLDFWMRCDGNRRNPGTTADLLTAGLFAVLRDGLILPPFQFNA